MVHNFRVHVDETRVWETDFSLLLMEPMMKGIFSVTKGLFSGLGHGCCALFLSSLKWSGIDSFLPLATKSRML